MITLKNNIQETVLENGLKVLTLEKHNVPIVCTMIWYKVGSVNEKEGETGLSHFLEHVMFKGTDRYRKGEIDLKTLINGGYNNAFTSHDYTAYFFNFASDRWEVALEIEANRMRNCTFDIEEFEMERKVVLEELKRNLDSPWGLLEMETEATMFLLHPYRHPVIGWQEDLERIPQEVVIQYYNTYYLPNNATLVIVGDFDTKKTLASVQKLFASIPPGPLPPSLIVQEPKQKGERRFKVIQETNLSRLEMAYHVGKINHPDSYTLDIIDTLLSSGKSSRLYQRLVEREKLVNFIHTSHDPRKYEGAFFIYTELRPGKSLSKVEKILSEELERLKQESISERELQRAKNIISADFTFDQETAFELANALGRNETIFRHDYLTTYLEHIEKISKEDISKVANQYFIDENRTVGWSIPEKTGKRTLVLDQFPSYPGGGIVGRKGAGFTRLTGSNPLNPAYLISSSINSVDLEPKKWVLENGLTVLFLENPFYPVTSIKAFVDAGQKYESEDKAGLAYLVGALLDEGTRERSGLEIAETMDFIGGSLETNSTGVATHILRKDLDTAFDIISDILKNAIFDEEEIEKERNKQLAFIKSEQDDPNCVAYNAFNELIYEKHPYHRPRRGYTRTVKAIRRSDILAHYQTYYRPNNTLLAIVGDLSEVEAREKVDQYFSSWSKKTSPAMSPLKVEKQIKPKIKYIFKTKEQIHIYLGHLGIRRNNPDYYALLVMDYILGTGPGFTDRISRKLRDEQGLAYTVYANITRSATEEPGIFSAYIGTSPENKDKAVKGLLKEIELIQKERVSEEELENAKNYLTGSYVFHFETSVQLANYLISAEKYQLGFDYLRKYPDLIRAVTAEDIQRVAQQYLDPVNYSLVIVGKIKC